mmetsp:Transcript_1621/g.2488  ORF Transcript_1621/g.2488 Transcript_1621/m.2488 type:complete len:209 (+) Transcript_1621:160-786(+)
MSSAHQFPLEGGKGRYFITLSLALLRHLQGIQSRLKFFKCFTSFNQFNQTFLIQRGPRRLSISGRRGNFLNSLPGQLSLNGILAIRLRCSLGRSECTLHGIRIARARGTRGSGNFDSLEFISECPHLIEFVFSGSEHLGERLNFGFVFGIFYGSLECGAIVAGVHFFDDIPEDTGFLRCGAKFFACCQSSFNLGRSGTSEGDRCSARL